MYDATHVSHCANPRPAPPRPAVSVSDGAHSVAPSAHATRTGASGDADVVGDGTQRDGTCTSLTRYFRILSCLSPNLASLDSRI